MEDYLREIELVLKCRMEEIPGILELCEGHIKEESAECSIEAVMLTKIKWVISEMLTNAVKHSGVDICRLKIIFSKKQLVIEKQDSGQPLILNNFDTGNKIIWPLQQQLENLNFQIYHNGMDSLRVRTDESDEATFFIDELLDVEMPALLTDISEHFGLLIITKASDKLTYKYDREKHMNRFRSHFNLI